MFGPLQVLAPPQDARRLAREQRKTRPDTAGDGWFDLPATQITPQVMLSALLHELLFNHCR